MWLRHLYFTSLSLSLLLRALHPSPTPPLFLPPASRFSIQSFRSLFAGQKKPGRCDKSALTWKSAPTRQRFSTRSIHDPVALPELNRPGAPPSPHHLPRLPSSLVSLPSRRSRAFLKHTDRALKKHFISDPVISGA